MARDEFDNAGEYVQVKDLEGKLVLFTPREYIEEMHTSFKDDADAVRTDLVVLDEDGQPEYEDVLIFQGALIGALKRRIKVEKSLDRDPVTGVLTRFETTTVKRVLGVIAKGEAKKGQSAPYVLETATDAQKDLARAYIADNPVPGPEKRVVSQELTPVAGVVQATVAPVADEFATTQASTPFASDAAPAADDPWAVEK